MNDIIERADRRSRAEAAESLRRAKSQPKSAKVRALVASRRKRLEAAERNLAAKRPTRGSC